MLFILFLPQVSMMFWFNFHQKICIGYIVLALMAEINSFFLHSRKLLQMMQIDYNSMLYKVVCILNITTFAVFRGYSNIRIEFGMITEYYRVPSYYFRCLIFSMTSMTMINVFLFWRLLKSDFLRKWSKRVVKPVLSSANMNGDHSLAHVKTDWFGETTNLLWCVQSCDQILFVLL